MLLHCYLIKVAVIIGTVKNRQADYGLLCNHPIISASAMLILDLNGMTVILITVVVLTFIPGYMQAFTVVVRKQPDHIRIRYCLNAKTVTPRGESIFNGIYFYEVWYRRKIIPGFGLDHGPVYRGPCLWTQCKRYKRFCKDGFYFQTHIRVQEIASNPKSYYAISTLVP